MESDERLIARLREAFEEEVAGVEVPQRVLAEVRQAVAADRRARPRPAAGRIALAAGVAAAIALAVLAVSLIGRHIPSPSPASAPTPTTDSVPAVPPPGPRLPRGTTAGPGASRANGFQGVVLPRTVRLVAETPDLAGGPPWGLREFRTAHGQTCLQVGRVQGSTIGTIGEDGAWLNDGRFHPIDPNAYTADHCTQTDGADHAFENVFDPSGATVSANVEWGDGAESHGCGGRRQPACPARDERGLYFGLLGPDAVSLTWVALDGQRFTEPANPPDGAYLIVTRAQPGPWCTFERIGGQHTRGCVSGGESSSSDLPAGRIIAVRYRDGHVCRLPVPSRAGVQAGRCPPVGYVAPAAPHVGRKQLATPIHTHILAGPRCSTPGGDAFQTCRPGQTPLLDMTGTYVIDISFTAHAPAGNDESYYRFEARYAAASRGCRGRESVEGGSTLRPIRPGQMVTFQAEVNRTCPETVEGSVSYVPRAGPGGVEGGMVARGTRGILVGRFSLRVP